MSVIFCKCGCGQQREEFDCRGRSREYIWSHSTKNKSFSEIHKQRLSENHADISGINNGNWKGGISKHYKTGYYSAEYKAWRKAVFIRDNFTCQGCGKMGYITAHHIKSFAHYPELRHEVDNGQTLCGECHMKTDNYKGRNKMKNRRNKIKGD